MDMYAFPIRYLDIEFCVSSYLHSVLVSLQPPSRYQSRTHLTSPQRRGASSVWWCSTAFRHVSRSSLLQNSPEPDLLSSILLVPSLFSLTNQPPTRGNGSQIGFEPLFSLQFSACVFPLHETPERPDTDTYTRIHSGITLHMRWRTSLWTDRRRAMRLRLP
jgi:hypothetical protein